MESNRRHLQRQGMIAIVSHDLVSVLEKHDTPASVAVDCLALCLCSVIFDTMVATSPAIRETLIARVMAHLDTIPTEVKKHVAH